jgi:nicotinamidase-related amidase
MKNADLHGNVPDHSELALLLIDVINDMEFKGSEKLVRHALPAAERIAELKKQARSLQIPTIYVNDNFGRWRSDFKAQLEHCLNDDVKGRPIAELLRPHETDYFVLKPKHSGFYSTTLDTLLRYLRAETLIITGFAANICVLFTANDAYMRDFELHIPSDCVASNTKEETDYALHQMQNILKADITPGSNLNLQALAESIRSRSSSKHSMPDVNIFNRTGDSGKRAS